MPARRLLQVATAVPAAPVWGAVFLGGVGRLLSWGGGGTPPAPFVGFLLLELVGPPLFVYWQHRAARSVGPVAESHL